MTRDVEVDADYQVGRGKPPKHTRFRPGQSGNPRGRPKGAKNFRTILEAALSERVVVKDNGRQRSYSKLEVIIRQNVNKAAGGEIKHTALLYKQLSMHLSGSEDAAVEPIHGGKDDEQLLAELLGQLGQSRRETGEPR